MLSAPAVAIVVDRDVVPLLGTGTDGDHDSPLEEEENENPVLADFARLDVGTGDRRAAEEAVAKLF